MSQPSLLRPLLLTCGLSLALVGCGTTSTANSRPTRFLSIQPIQVCDDLGIFCADLALFEEETRKIWGNVDIDITFLAPNRLLDSRYLTIDSRDEFAEISFSGGSGAFGRNPASSRTSGPINMWFVDQILLGAADVFGLAWVDQNGVLISDDIRTFNNGIGRRDTVAHELGHNLGLSHNDDGAGPASNLMSSGSVRAIPNSVADIAPDGARLSRLTNEQADVARSSSLVTGSSGSSGSGGTEPPSPGLLEQLLRFLEGEDHDHDAPQFDAAPRLAESASLPWGDATAPAPLASDYGLPPEERLMMVALASAPPQTVPEPSGLLWIPGSLLLAGGWRLWRRVNP